MDVLPFEIYRRTGTEQIDREAVPQVMETGWRQR
jgi:hypothetical protein